MSLIYLIKEIEEDYRMFLFRLLYISVFLLFSFSSLAIYDLKTNKETSPKEPLKKHWLLVAESCHSCSELLVELNTFCSGKKPSSSQIGFLLQEEVLKQC